MSLRQGPSQRSQESPEGRCRASGSRSVPRCLQCIIPGLSLPPSWVTPGNLSWELFAHSACVSEKPSPPAPSASCRQSRQGLDLEAQRASAAHTQTCQSSAKCWRLYVLPPQSRGATIPPLTTCPWSEGALKSGDAEAGLNFPPFPNPPHTHTLRHYLGKHEILYL